MTLLLDFESRMLNVNKKKTKITFYWMRWVFGHSLLQYYSFRLFLFICSHRLGIQNRIFLSYFFYDYVHHIIVFWLSFDTHTTGKPHHKTFVQLVHTRHAFAFYENLTIIYIFRKFQNLFRNLIGSLWLVAVVDEGRPLVFMSCVASQFRSYTKKKWLSKIWEDNDGNGLKIHGNSRLNKI